MGTNKEYNWNCETFSNKKQTPLSFAYATEKRKVAQ
jgi:hypothetical protein